MAQLNWKITRHSCGRLLMVLVVRCGWSVTNRPNGWITETGQQWWGREREAKNPLLEWCKCTVYMYVSVQVSSINWPIHQLEQMPVARAVKGKKKMMKERKMKRRGRGKEEIVYTGCADMQGRFFFCPFSTQPSSRYFIRLSLDMWVINGHCSHDESSDHQPFLCFTHSLTVCPSIDRKERERKPKVTCNHTNVDVQQGWQVDELTWVFSCSWLSWVERERERGRELSLSLSAFPVQGHKSHQV